MDLREYANAARYLRRALPLHRSDSFSSSVSGATATTAAGGAGGGSVHGSRVAPKAFAEIDSCTGRTHEHCSSSALTSTLTVMHADL
eukprot:9664-Heterococcus_DN1.PRE.1